MAVLPVNRPTFLEGVYKPAVERLIPESAPWSLQKNTKFLGELLLPNTPQEELTDALVGMPSMASIGQAAKAIPKGKHPIDRIKKWLTRAGAAEELQFSQAGREIMGTKEPMGPEDLERIAGNSVDYFQERVLKFPEEAGGYGSPYMEMTPDDFPDIADIPQQDIPPHMQWDPTDANNPFLVRERAADVEMRYPEETGMYRAGVIEEHELVGMVGHDNARIIVDNTPKVDPKSLPRFAESRYTLEGGMNYREILVKRRRSKLERQMYADAKLAEEHLEHINAIIDKDTINEFNIDREYNGLPPLDYENYRQTEDTMNDLLTWLREAKNDRARLEGYQSSHWPDDQDVLFHIRASDRYSEEGLDSFLVAHNKEYDKRMLGTYLESDTTRRAAKAAVEAKRGEPDILFVDELQSDYARDWRKQELAKKRYMANQPRPHDSFAPPDIRPAPFITDNRWWQKAFDRMLWEAARNPQYKYLAWTPPELQMSRNMYYHYTDSVHVARTGPDEFMVLTVPSGNQSPYRKQTMFMEVVSMLRRKTTYGQENLHPTNRLLPVVLEGGAAAHEGALFGRLDEKGVRELFGDDMFRSVDNQMRVGHTPREVSDWAYIKANNHPDYTHFFEQNPYTYYTKFQYDLDRAGPIPTSMKQSVPLLRLKKKAWPEKFYGKDIYNYAQRRVKPFGSEVKEILSPHMDMDFSLMRPGARDEWISENLLAVEITDSMRKAFGTLPGSKFNYWADLPKTALGAGLLLAGEAWSDEEARSPRFSTEASEFQQETTRMLGEARRKGLINPGPDFSPELAPREYDLPRPRVPGSKSKRKMRPSSFKYYGSPHANPARPRTKKIPPGGRGVGIQ